MVVGGSGGMTGAPMFVSHAAMRAGAGIVWCGLPGDDAAACRLRYGGDRPPTARHPERRPGPERGGAGVGDDRPVRALAVGPGLGPTWKWGLAARALVAEACAPLVLDADGLNVLKGDFAVFDARRTWARRRCSRHTRASTSG